MTKYDFSEAKAIMAGEEPVKQPKYDFSEAKAIMTGEESDTPTEQKYDFSEAKAIMTEEPSTVQQIKSGLNIGATEALIPHAISTEEARKPLTGIESASKIGGSIITDLVMGAALPAAAGFSVGGPVGAAVGVSGSLIYGLYRAYGMEELESRRADREFSPINFGINAGLEANYLLKYGGGAIAKIAKGAVQAGGTAGQAGLYGASSPGEFFVAMALGGLGGATTAKGIVDPKATKAITNTAKKAIKGRIRWSEFQKQTALEFAEINRFKNASKSGADLQAKLLEDPKVLDALADEVIEKGATLETPRGIRRIAEDGAIPNINIKDLPTATRTAQEFGMSLEFVPGLKKPDGSKANTRLLHDGTIQVGTKDINREVGREIKGLIEQRSKRWISWILNRHGEAEPNIRKFHDEIKTYPKIAQDAAYVGFQTQGIKVQKLTNMIETGDKRLSNVKGVTFGSYFGDDLWWARNMDEANGATNWAETFSITTEANQRMTTAYAAIGKEAQGVEKGLNKAKIREGAVIDGNKMSIMKIIEGRHVDKLPENQKVAVKAYQKLLEDFRKTYDGTTIKIDEFSGGQDVYFPHVVASPAKLVRRLKNNIRKGEDLETTYDLIAKNTGTRPETPEQAMQLANDIINIPKEDLSSNLSTTHSMERKGKLLPIELEEDPMIVFNRYVKDQLTSVFYKDALNHAGINIGILQELAKTSPKVKRDLARAVRWTKDITHSQKGRLNAWMETTANKTENYFYDIMDDAGSSNLKKKAAEFGVEIPKLMNFITSSIYTNQLGFQVRAPARNMTQTYLLTAPELTDHSVKYGYSTVGESIMRAGNHIRKNKTMRSFLQEKGLQSGHVINESFKEGSEEISRELRALGWLVNKAKWMGDKGMTLYSASDDANRLVTYFVGQKVAKDALAGNKSAIHYITKVMPQAKRTEIRLALNAKNTKRVGDIISRELIEKTQFMYNKHSRSEFARDFGQLATMFTKWPNMNMNNVADMLKKGRKYPLAATYLASLVGLSSVAHSLDLFDVYENPIAKRIIGKDIKAVTQISPTGSLLGVSTPPVLGAVGKIVKAASEVALEQDLGKAATTAVGAGKPFVPMLNPVTNAYKLGKELTE